MKRIMSQFFLTWNEAHKAKESIANKIMNDPNIISIGTLKKSENMYVITVSALDPPQETSFDGVPVTYIKGEIIRAQC
jgi:hypothetical protein